MRDLSKTADFCQTYDDYCAYRYEKYDTKACQDCPMKPKDEPSCDGYLMMSKYELQAPILQQWLMQNAIGGQ